MQLTCGFNLLNAVSSVDGVPQRVSNDEMGFEGFQGGSKEVSKGFKGFQDVKLGVKRFQGLNGCFKGLNGISNRFQQGLKRFQICKMEVPSSFNVKSEVSTATVSICSKGLQKGLQEVKNGFEKVQGRFEGVSHGFTGVQEVPYGFMRCFFFSKKKKRFQGFIFEKRHFRVVSRVEKVSIGSKKPNGVARGFKVLQ